MSTRAIRDFAEIKPIDARAPIMGMNSAADLFNGGFDALNRVIQDRQAANNMGIERDTKNNDLAIQAAIQEYGSLAEFKKAQEEQLFADTAWNSKYGTRYSQDRVKGLVDSRLASLRGKATNDAYAAGDAAAKAGMDINLGVSAVQDALNQSGMDVTHAKGILSNYLTQSDPMQKQFAATRKQNTEEFINSLGSNIPTNNADIQANVARAQEQYKDNGGINTNMFLDRRDNLLKRSKADQAHTQGQIDRNLRLSQNAEDRSYMKQQRSQEEILRSAALDARISAANENAKISGLQAKLNKIPKLSTQGAQDEFGSNVFTMSSVINGIKGKTGTFRKDHEEALQALYEQYAPIYGEQIASGWVAQAYSETKEGKDSVAGQGVDLTGITARMEAYDTMSRRHTSATSDVNTTQFAENLRVAQEAKAAFELSRGRGSKTDVPEPGKGKIADPIGDQVGSIAKQYGYDIGNNVVPKKALTLNMTDSSAVPALSSPEKSAKQILQALVKPKVKPKKVFRGPKDATSEAPSDVSLISSVKDWASKSQVPNSVHFGENELSAALRQAGVQEGSHVRNKMAKQLQATYPNASDAELIQLIKDNLK